MKRRSAKPSDEVMRFFTPTLYLNYNSDDDEVANRADQDWEIAVRNYRRHLKLLRPRMPDTVRRLSELSLHDAEVLSCDQEMEPIAAGKGRRPKAGIEGRAVAFLTLKKHKSLVSLVYFLGDRMRPRTAKRNWPFSREHRHWLYDEIDVASEPHGMFVHRILFSDGRMLEIPFTGVLLHTSPLAAEPSVARAGA